MAANKIEVDSFVILTKNISNIELNSVGLVQAINGDFAIFLFIGKNEIIRVLFENLLSINIKNTGKGFENKICNICHILKPTNAFDVNQTDAKGNKTTRPSCKECRKDID